MGAHDSRDTARTMSQENVAVVQNLYEVMRQVGPGAVLDLPDTERRRFFDSYFEPDLELRQSRELVLDSAGVFHGYEGFMAAARELLGSLSDIRWEVDDVFASGDTVVCDVRALASGVGSGIPLEHRMAHLWGVRNGRLSRWIVYPTVAEALTAAGLSE